MQNIKRLLFTLMVLPIFQPVMADATYQQKPNCFYWFQWRHKSYAAVFKNPSSTLPNIWPDGANTITSCNPIFQERNAYRTRTSK